MMVCKTPGCLNPPSPKRRICSACRARQSWAAEKRRRQPTRPGEFGCNKTCCHFAACKLGRVAMGPGLMPCETLLEDEVGKEYEAGELTLWPSVGGVIV